MATTNNNRTRKILKRTLLTLLAIVVVLCAAIGIILNTVVTPKRITPVLISLANDYLNADVQCESVDITFFSTFPDLGIKLNNGYIVNTMQTEADSIWQSSAQDTLLIFREGLVSLDPTALLFGKKIVVHKFSIEDADIYGFVNTDGKANWDIVKPSIDESATEEETSSELPEFDINDIRLTNIRITYDDLQQDMFVSLDSIGMRLSGKMSKENANLNLGFRTSGITTLYQGQSFSTALPFSIRTKLQTDRVARNITIDRGAVSVGILQLRTQGKITKGELPETADIDLEFSLNASSLADVLDMVPPQVSDIVSRLTAGGSIESDGKLTGQIGKDQYPQLSLSVKLNDGSIASRRAKDKPFLNSINIDFSTFIDIMGKQPSSLKLNKLEIQSSSSKLSAKGNFEDIFNTAAIEASAKANIDFTRMSRHFTDLEEMKMGGMIDFDISAKCLLGDILTANLGKINANGTANIRDITLSNMKENFSFFATNANLRFGSNTQDSVRGRLLESLLRGSLSLDSMNINWKDEIKANAGKMSARFSTSEPKDTNSIAPVLTNVRAENLRIDMSDTVRIRALHTSASLRLQPSKENASLPEISARIALDTLGGRMASTVSTIRNANLNLKLSRVQPRAGRQRLRVQQDSIGTAVQGDSTVVTRRRNTAMTRAQRDSLRQIQINPETNLSFQLESQETRELLRKWNVSGSFGCTSMRLRTPFFPLPIRVTESQMQFTTDNLKVEKAGMEIGSSAFNLSGDIEGIRRALLFNGKVTAKMDLTADSLDFNQLIKAAVAGSEYMNKSTLEKDSISELVLDESKALPIDVDTIQSGIFVVPRNLDIEFNSRIRNARFSDINVQNVRGRIILRDQAIQLPRLSIRSNIGSTNMTMVYKAADSKGAHVGLDLEINRMDIKELIEAFPMMDELTPMLRSFEGVVDCDMTAVTELDSAMNVLLPQTSASCHVRGKNMVLLDGETFSEISKMLRFKNKNRNQIDSISVEMILEDEKLLIFPFQVSLDRYNVAVGGVQNLDLTFDYHITVLKSPLPFKLGLNIRGDMDNMKIRLAKAKYKDLFTVARQEDLTNTVINVRQEMGNKLRKNIEEIIGSDLSRPVRRARSSLPDSLRRNFFQLDTTAVSVEEVPDSIPLQTE